MVRRSRSANSSWTLDLCVSRRSCRSANRANRALRLASSLALRCASFLATRWRCVDAPRRGGDLRVDPPTRAAELDGDRRLLADAPRRDEDARPRRGGDLDRLRVGDVLRPVDSQYSSSCSAHCVIVVDHCAIVVDHSAIVVDHSRNDPRSRTRAS